MFIYFERVCSRQRHQFNKSIIIQNPECDAELSAAGAGDCIFVHITFWQLQCLQCPRKYKMMFVNSIYFTLAFLRSSLAPTRQNATKFEKVRRELRTIPAPPSQDSKSGLRIHNCFLFTSLLSATWVKVKILIIFLLRSLKYCKLFVSIFMSPKV